MAPKIQKVAVAGATGNVGSHVLKALIQDGFQVTVLTRKQGSFPDGVTVKVIDYNSYDALKEAFQGHEAFVDCTLVQDDTPARMIDAAAAAGVYRYIPSDFSLDFNNPKPHTLPIWFKKDANDKHLLSKCQSTQMTWSIICNGAFLDYTLRTGFLNIDIYNKKVNYMNDGSNVIAWTTLESVGKAVSGTLSHPAETENRPVYVHSVYKSQKQMADLCKDALGSDGWEETESNMEERFAAAMKEIQAGNFNFGVLADMIRYANSRPDFSSPWSQDDNALLGVKTLSDNDLKELIKQLAANKA
ncbi:isoflavone reductase family protein [Colletotrichum truncatum]|uniref:Isoflavone reductase family protein n=1 Tax=Colletotrichum truncatum TaxID=5467 RepID=A0ACC3ZC23_COLTU|nr:isoflavone reductase family protein [Colletotrichum truncatum]KAF6782260.1 isoflavone reductase family protein [Colletotrichum truncatum]